MAAAAISLALSEQALRWQRARVKQSDALDRGLVRHDPELGWALSEEWSGRHRHRDFDVTYSVDSRGFRRQPGYPAHLTRRPLTICVGDSFTFGLGVGDEAPFARQLNELEGGRGLYLNCGVPGYSTDQEVLLTETRLLGLKPDRVLLVVYVANDLFDNLRSVPLQVGSRKPFFELVPDGRLVLRDHPVAAATARVAPDPGALLENVLGTDHEKWSWRHRLEQESELFRSVSQSLIPEPDRQSEWQDRFAPACRLFAALLERLSAACGRAGADLVVVTLAGRSFFDSPRSLSARYQDHLLDRVATICRGQGIPAIDLPRQMLAGPSQRAGWFHRHDGHLTTEGHQVVSRLLHQTLERLPLGKPERPPAGG